MGSRGIARPGKAGRFWQRRFVYVHVVALQNTLAAALTRDAHICGEIIGRRAGDTTLGHAAVAVAVKNVTFVIHCDLVKIKQVAIVMAATLLPDASHALNGIIRSGVYRRPRGAAIVGGGDERI